MDPLTINFKVIGLYDKQKQFKMRTAILVCIKMFIQDYGRGKYFQRSFKQKNFSSHSNDNCIRVKMQFKAFQNVERASSIKTSFDTDWWYYYRLFSNAVMIYFSNIIESWIACNIWKTIGNIFIIVKITENTKTRESSIATTNN